MQRQLQGLGRHETVDTAHGDSIFSEDSEISSSERLRRFETNAVGACFVAVTAISMDALSAIPTVVVKATPSSLRCTAMVLIFCLGAPIVSPDAADVDLTWQQRGLAVIGLIIVAALGEPSDALRCPIGGGAMLEVADGAEVAALHERRPRPPRRGG